MPTSRPPSRPDPLSRSRRKPRSSIRGPDTLRERSPPQPPPPNEPFASEFLPGKIKGGRLVRPPCKEMLSFWARSVARVAPQNVSRITWRSRPFDLFRIARLVLVDLKRQETMDGVKRAGVLRGDAHASAAGHLLVSIGDRLAQFLHLLCAVGHPIMDEHGLREIPLCERFCNRPQMLADGVDRLPILRIVGAHLDRAAVAQQAEGMFCRVLRETHGL